MGAWGYKIFENDAAVDFISFFTANPSVKELRRKIRAASQLAESEYLDSYLASEVLAAIKIAISLTRTDDSLPQEFLQTLGQLKTKTNSLEIKEKIFPDALAALHRIKTNSELQELWQETKEYAQWLNEIEKIAKVIEQE
ncbi:MAG TPA: DUF4259 domain-containing protein [Patescibacteria group bacterium]